MSGNPGYNYSLWPIGGWEAPSRYFHRKLSMVISPSQMAILLPTTGNSGKNPASGWVYGWRKRMTARHGNLNARSDGDRLYYAGQGNMLMIDRHVESGKLEVLRFSSDPILFYSLRE